MVREFLPEATYPPLEGLFSAHSHRFLRRAISQLMTAIIMLAIIAETAIAFPKSITLSAVSNNATAISSNYAITVIPRTGPRS